MSAPIRLQLSRRKGFDLQAASRAANGLPAVVVVRPSRWGNPFAQPLPVLVSYGGDAFRISGCSLDPADAFRLWLEGKVLARDFTTALGLARDDMLRALPKLAGKNLACWCACGPGVACHADVLLDLANRPACEEVRP